ncbi:hypothetical protein EEZ25_33545 [Micromonospora aurantiaca]|nr:hypothetical protein EEZ25_33545 [Micromonospora aurantiaca]
MNAIARNKVNLDRIVTRWPDMLRVTCSLITNQVRAYDLLRILTRDGHPTPLGQALAEYGRIANTPPGCPRSGMRTSTCSVVTASPPRAPRRSFGRSAIRTRS